jgi:DNA-binding beta-propeller fold protein YncE
MATTWKINNVMVYNTLDGNSDVIYLVNYNVTATGNEGPYALFKEATIDTSSITDFVPFADLTEEVVLGWVTTDLGADGVAAIDQEAEDELSFFMNTSIKTL